MKPAIYESLRRLHEQFGSKEFGKIAQKFVAIAYASAGYEHVIERAVQGVDVDAARSSGEKYATEVKTALNSRILYKEKDSTGLAARAKDGYEPVLACLWLSPLSQWIFAGAGALRVGFLNQDQVRPHRLKNLECEIVPYIDRAVAEHFQGAMEGAQGYLAEVLKTLGAEVTE